MLTTHCLFLCPISIVSAPGTPSFLLWWNGRFHWLGDLSKEQSSIWDELGSTGAKCKAIVGEVEDIAAGMAESSWQCNSMSRGWLGIVESWVISSTRSLQPSLSVREGRETRSHGHSSESLPHFIWTSRRCCCCVTRSGPPSFTRSLRAREGGWWGIDRLFRRETRHPPSPPFPCCLVRLPETTAAMLNSSESSELPSYGSKNYNHKQTCIQI